MRNTIEDRDKLADKISSDDKYEIKRAVDDAQLWLVDNEESGTKEDYEDKLKEVQRVCDPIIAKLYQRQGG